MMTRIAAVTATVVIIVQMMMMNMEEKNLMSVSVMESFLLLV